MDEYRSLCSKEKDIKNGQKHIIKTLVVTHIFWKLAAQKNNNIFAAIVLKVFPQFVFNHQPNQLPTSEAVVRLILSYAITLPLRDFHRRLQIPLAGLPESLLQLTRHKNKARVLCVLCVFFRVGDSFFKFISIIIY